FWIVTSLGFADRARYRAASWMPVEIKCCWSSSHENSNTPSTKLNRSGRRIVPSISADPSLSHHRDCCMRTDMRSLPVQLNHVVINVVGRLDETQELAIW